MKIKLPALMALSLLLSAGSALALQTDDLIAVSAMPLAVADVVALPDVPQNDVMTVVTTLNRAAVPAPQFVEIVRYAPVAIVQPVEPNQPRFVTYVTDEYDRGIVGEPLALAISDRYNNTYGIDDVQMQNPPVVTYVQQQQVLPATVVTQFQPVQFDPLSVIAMPLAVAAVADLVNVPTSDLMQLVSSLNQASVPAPQFVEVVRYSPVVFVDRTESPRFIRYVTTEVDRGVYGRPLAYAIADRIRTYEPVQINVRQPLVVRQVIERDEILPPVVTRRVATTRVAPTRVARVHPLGGPPGQVKKQLGLQTGAEVVHGAAARRVAPTRTVRTPERHVVTEHRAAPVQRHVEKPRKVERKHEAPRVMSQPVQKQQHVQRQHAQPQRLQQQQRAPKAQGHGNAGNHGGGHGQGKGKKKG